MKYIIANWKANKNALEITNWFKIFSKFYKENNNKKLNNLEIIVCPPYIFLPLVKTLVEDYDLPIKIGAQDTSPFGNGAYTGAVTAAMLSEFVQYIIIGHSERRSYFMENDKVLKDKVKRARERGIIAVYCIPDENASIPEEIKIIAYEPVWAIGTGKTETPEKADRIASLVKGKHPRSVLIYGGSINPENVKNFANFQNIDGFLVGGASLDPQKFWEIIANASTI